MKKILTVQTYGLSKIKSGNYAKKQFALELVITHKGKKIKYLGGFWNNSMKTSRGHRALLYTGKIPTKKVIEQMLNDQGACSHEYFD